MSAQEDRQNLPDQPPESAEESAVDGVEVQTETVWRMAEDEGIARAVFINKLDRERSSHSRTMAELKESFGTGIAPLQVPIGVEHDLSGVANLVGNEAYTYEEGSLRASKVDLPDSVKQEVEVTGGDIDIWSLTGGFLWDPRSKGAVSPYLGHRSSRS